jgi:release factor glutamine methyltransferase
LLEGATGLSSLDLLTRADQAVGEENAARLEKFLERRLQDEPVSRILGRSGFYGLDLVVTPDVLDPRADTEGLVDAALAFLRETPVSSPRILDLGTGAGAILCAILQSVPNAHGFGVDLSRAACAVARKNLELCGLAGRGSIVCGDWADAIGASFDLIVSNPPYIGREEAAALEPEVARFDPALALFGGEGGLACYRRLAGDISRLLKPGGGAFLEIGWRQAQAVGQVLSEAGFRNVAVFKDHSGRDRIAVVRKV